MEGFFEWVLESSLLVVMVLVIRRLFMGRIRYAAIYALWLIVLLRFIIPVNFIPAPINIGNVFSDAILSGLSEDGSTYDSGAEDTLYGSGTEDGKKEYVPGLHTANVLSEKENVNIGSGIQEHGRRAFGIRSVMFCSIIISAVLFLWIIISNIRMARWIKRRRIFYCRQNGVNVYTVCGIGSPCLYGFLRPAIYIPQELVIKGGNMCINGRDGLGSKELEQIITHEYVHYIHKDHIWSVFRILLISVYWFHPLLWAAVICSKKDAELFCDETVVCRIGEKNRLFYGQTLVRLARHAGWSDFRYSMTPMSRGGKEMEHRIRAISSRRRYSVWMTVPMVLAAALALGATCGTGTVKIKGSMAANSIIIPEAAINLNAADTDAGQEQYARMADNGGYVRQGAIAPVSHSDGEEVLLDAGIFSADCEQAFSNYINIFTEAVNSGNTDSLNLVLKDGSSVYEQQCNIVDNYYNRGIREEVRSYEIVSISYFSEDKAEITSKEKIKVYYAKGASKTVRQEYKYTCERINGGWIITEMSDVDNNMDTGV